VNLYTESDSPGDITRVKSDVYHCPVNNVVGIGRYLHGVF